jgi:hypothetical protein
MLVVFHDLHVEIPLRVLTAFDRLEQILGSRSQILGLHLRGFLSREARQPAARVEVVLHEHGVTLRVDHLVRVHAEAFHVTVARGNAARAEQVRQHVHRFGCLAHEVEDAVRLLPERHRIRLQRVDHIGELDGVTDEEDREVVPHEIPVAVLGVELHRKAARIARNFGRIPSADDSGEPDGERCLLARGLKELGTRVLRRGLLADLPGGFELAIAHEAPGVHDALGNALAVEVADLLEEVVVLERGRTATPDGPLRLVVGDRMALSRGQGVLGPGFVFVLLCHNSTVYALPG